MIIDTSAIIAILYDEAGSDRLARSIEEAHIRRMSAGTLVELFVVVARQKNPLLRRQVDDFLRELRAEIEPVTEAQAHIAREAYNAYGKGRGARSTGSRRLLRLRTRRARNEPLLFVGDNFIHTDIRPALADERGSG